MSVYHNLPHVELLNYTPAVLKHNSRGFYIEYFVRHPDSGHSQRFRQSFNELRKRTTLRDFQKQTANILAALNAKLAAGWTPFVNDGNALRFTPIDEALSLFLNKRRRELREATFVAYSSQCNILLRYLERIGMKNASVGQFTHYHAIRFMDWLYDETDIDGKQKKALSNNAYNSYLKKYLAIFSWLTEREYLETNPFQNIRTKPKQDKRRATVSPELRARILEYLRDNNPHFVMVLHLVYNSLIRPKEIETIQIRDINLSEHWIHISSDNAKTHKERYAPITDQMVTILREWNISAYPPTFYLIGNKFVPSRTRAYHGQYKKEFLAIKKKLHLPQEIQLYSFKDTGISDMFAAGLDALTVMQAADHHDLSVTTRYACQAKKDMIRHVVEAGTTL